jgi:hypothetical protein
MAYPLKRGHRAKMDQWAKGLRLSMFCQCPRCRTLRALSCSDPIKALLAALGVAAALKP